MANNSLRQRSGFFRKFAVYLLCIFIVLSAIPVYAHDESSGTDSDNSSIFVPKSKENTAEQNYDSEERVRIIVELEDSPLLSYQSSMQVYSSASDFFTSSEGQSIEKKLEQNRKQVTKALTRSDMDIDVEYEYSTVINGIAVEADAGDLEAIRQIDGVKNAFIEECHPLIKPVENQPYTSGSVPSIGGDIVSDNLGFTGKGTVVAILDTGLYLKHEAFQGSVNGAKYTKQDIESLIKNNKLTVGKLSVDSLYQSEKIPFAYDYADVDTNVSGGENHGTHVAGIVGANSGGTVTGVAPDAQFFIMKVFGDSTGGAYDSDILAALDDSIKLGADVINMSLGSTGGFTEEANKTMSAVYQRVADAGINLICAAGNDYSSSYGNPAGNDLPNAENPDNGTVASPSTYPAATSVASMNNVKTTSVYMIAGERQIRYSDAAEKASKQLISISGTYTYVNCGYGSTSDFTNEVRGKIALIQRGGKENGEVLTFTQKEANAKNAGAVAVIIYDNVSGALVSMATEELIPCVFISKTDGEYLCNAENKTITISEDYVSQFQDAYSGKMSDFSSWGTTPDLKLKPEITAPGGDIYSTLPNNLYGNMSGTSMASPHMAGAAAIMDQYIRENLNGLNMSQSERSSLSNALMMSTAVPIKDDNNLYFSPRKQGAGLVQLQNAVTAGACLTNSDGGKPKAELGDSQDGKFSFSFKAKSLSDSSITYQVETVVLTENLVTSNGVSYIAQAARKLENDEVTVNAPSTVTVGSNAEEKISVSISLTEKGKQNLDKAFPNGIYIEGYVILTPADNSESVSLSIPFMGFYGDWDSVPIFDSTIYDDKTSAIYEMQLGQFSDYDGSGYILGKNLYITGSNDYDADKIAIKGGDDTKHVTAVTALLRSVDKLQFSVEDSVGDPVYTETLNQVCKTYFDGEAYYTPMADKGWKPFDTWNDALSDGLYTYKVTGTINGKSETVTFPITVDTQKPEVISSEVTGSLWKVKVKDNHYIQAACAVGSGNKLLTSYIEPDAETAGAVSELVFDLSDPAFSGVTQAKIALLDYAENQYVSDFYSLSEAEIVNPTSISLNKTEVFLNVGDSSTLTAEVLPANASNKTVNWESSKSSVASVDKNGKITAVSAGTAKITATTVNGLKKECTVTVSDTSSLPPVSNSVIASVYAPSYVAAGSLLPFDLQLEKMKRVSTVSFTFEKDSDLSFKSLEGLNGFSSLGVVWENSNKGVLALTYLKNGAQGSLTSDVLTDIAKLTFETTKTSGSYGIKITGVTVAGYDDKGEPIYLTSQIKTDRAQTSISAASRFDLNNDGIVDILDITYCQMFYQSTPNSANWSKASACDLDGNKKIDIEDMIIILQNYTDLKK